MAFDESLALPKPAKLDKRIGVSSPNTEVLDPWGEEPSEGLPQLRPLSLPILTHPSPTSLTSDLERHNSRNSASGWGDHDSELFLSDPYHVPLSKLSLSDAPVISKAKQDQPSSWDELYTAPTVDYEAEIMEAKLKTRTFVYKDHSKQSTQTEPHPHQPKEFDWTNYKLEEMISFQANDIPFIVEALVTKSVPSNQYEMLLSPANGIFLCARYAHHIHASNLFDSLLTVSIHTIHNVVKEKQHDIIQLSYWLTNCSQLLYYLKRDHGLAVATIEQQVLIPEILYDGYSAIVQGIQDQLSRLLKSCMLEHEIPGLDVVQFKENPKDKHSTPRPTSPRQIPYSPRTLITVLDSLLNVFKSYFVPSGIVQRGLSQIYSFLSASLFNLVLEDRRFCCRVKALQLRMNLSSLEEWARSNMSNSSLATAHLKPLVQLLELLQCASHLDTISNFTDTVRSWDSLTASQAHYVLSQYYYEIDELPLNPAILSLSASWATRHPTMTISDLACKPTPTVSEKPTRTKQKQSNQFSKNPHHMLPFGPPSQAEMSAWWEDYVPFLPFHIHQALHSETALSSSP